MLTKIKTVISGLDPVLVERRTVVGLLLIYLVFQANAALHHGSWGQDFSWHIREISAARAHPWQFSLRTDVRGPEPPLFHLLAAAVVQITGGHDAVETIAFLSILANFFGLIMIYGLICRLVGNRILRLSCFVSIAFLPVMMIHEVVLASDALTLPIFSGILTLLAGVIDSRVLRLFWPRILGISLLLIIGVGTKYIFGSQAVALFGIFCLFPFLKILDRYRTTWSLITVGIAVIINLVVLFNASGFVGIHHSDWAMTWRDILFLHRRDIHVLSAPQYNEARGAVRRGIQNAETETPLDQYELLTPGRYSYAALVHLGIFTDILNIYQDDPTDSYFGQRTRTNESRMRVAVKTGLAFSLSGLFLATVALVRTCYLTLLKRQREDVLRFSLAVCGLAWFLNIIVFLPSVPAYIGGFWTPRLILPALLAFIILSYTELDRFLCGRTSRWSWAILVLVLLQSSVQLSFLWPHGSISPFFK